MKKNLLLLNNICLSVLVISLVAIMVLGEKIVYFKVIYLNDSQFNDILFINQKYSLNNICNLTTKSSAFSPLCQLKKESQYNLPTDDMVIIKNFQIALTKEGIKSELSSQEYIKVLNRIGAIKDDDDYKKVSKIYLFSLVK